MREGLVLVFLSQFSASIYVDASAKLLRLALPTRMCFHMVNRRRPTISTATLSGGDAICTSFPPKNTPGAVRNRKKQEGGEPKQVESRDARDATNLHSTLVIAMKRFAVPQRR